MTFSDLKLHPQILKALDQEGYKEPTKIQEQAIPKVAKGIDLRASAQTGTGKTAAFLLPALDHIVKNPAKSGKGPRVLILAPTRELAMQIAEQSNKYSQYLNKLFTVCVSGGVPLFKQFRKLNKPYDVLIATPGRLIDLMERRKVSFDRLEMLVLDEADRMLDMGFMESVEQIVAATPKTRQTLLFSATLEGEVLKMSERLLNNPLDIIVHSKQEKHEHITQRLHYVDNIGHKNRLLDHILSEDDVQHAIVFTSTKRHAGVLVEELHRKGFRVGALHGDMSQRQRTRTVGHLKDGKIKILVATDVAARGIDVQSITHVINFDLPRDHEDYVHRIGRTGRAGAKGTALSFATGKESVIVKRIEKFTGQPIDVVEIKGLEPCIKQTSVREKRSPEGFKRRGPGRFGRQGKNKSYSRAKK